MNQVARTRRPLPSCSDLLMVFADALGVIVLTASLFQLAGRATAIEAWPGAAGGIYLLAAGTALVASAAVYFNRKFLARRRAAVLAACAALVFAAAPFAAGLVSGSLR